MSFLNYSATETRSRLEGLDTLTDDSTGIDFDADNFDNKEVTWTLGQTATLSATIEGPKSLTIKSSDGNPKSIAFSNGNIIGSPPAVVSSTDGAHMEIFYDGTNFKFL